MNHFLDGYLVFLDTVFSNLENVNIQVNDYLLDHIAYRATTDGAFKKSSEELDKIGDKIHEIIIRNRYIYIYKLKNNLFYKSRKIEYLELLAPAKGDRFKEGFEHVEFVVNENLREFVKRHSSLEWNINSIDREIGAEIGLIFKNGCNVKFKNMTISEIIRMESSGNTFK